MVMNSSNWCRPRSSQTIIRQWDQCQDPGLHVRLVKHRGVCLVWGNQGNLFREGNALALGFKIITSHLGNQRLKNIQIKHRAYGKTKRIEKLSSVHLQKRLLGNDGKWSKRHRPTSGGSKSKGLVSQAEKFGSHHRVSEGLEASDMASFTLETNHSTSSSENSLEGDEAGDKELNK